MKKIILFLLSMVVLHGCTVNDQTNTTMNGAFLNSEECAGMGETIGAKDMPLSCCSTLTLVGGWGGGYEGDCSIPPPPSGLNRCAPCGNNICDTEYGENKCNCPTDCGR